MDQDLVVRVQQGDERAFEALASADYPRLHRVAYSVLGDPASAEAWAPTISGMSDPRLDGAMTYSADEDGYAPFGSYTFGAATYRIETDDGAWQGSTPIFLDGSTRGPGVVVLVGEGAYEGLYAWMDTSDWSAISGVIFPAPPPEAPTAP